MHKRIALIYLVALILGSTVQAQTDLIDSFHLYGDIKVTIDRPSLIDKGQETIICFYALPNGNSTEQTMGKRLQPGDDWHFDIQHIKAQTKFIRKEFGKKNFIVIYLENNYKSWPLWKQRHADFRQIIPHFIDSLASSFQLRKYSIYLNGHSGGGSLIFGYLAGVEKIPTTVKRISFIDSNYGYDSSYYPKLRSWLKEVKNSMLTVFAYNDSVAIYNGKQLVSATGGTWYRSRLMLKHLEKDFVFQTSMTDSMIIHRSTDGRIHFYLKFNLNHGIYHTQQVEFNGFIHSILLGTRRESKKYKYYTARAYQDLIE